MASLRGDDLGESSLVQEVGEMVDLRGEEQDSANDGDAGDSFALDPEPMEKDLSDGRLGVGNAGGAAVCRTTVPWNCWGGGGVTYNCAFRGSVRLVCG